MDHLTRTCALLMQTLMQILGARKCALGTGAWPKDQHTPQSGKTTHAVHKLSSTHCHSQKKSWNLSSWIHNRQIHTNCLLKRVIFARVFQGKQSSVCWSCDVDWLSQERARTHSHPHTENIPGCPLPAKPSTWPLHVTQSNGQYLLSSS